MLVENRKFNTPLTLENAISLLDSLELSEGDRALDVGCGTGEMLALLLERTGCRTVGIDPKVEEIALARERTRPHEDRAEWHACSIEEMKFESPFNAAICVGATHAFGGPGEALAKTIDALRGLVVPGGRLLIGEGYRKQPPPQPYLKATGISEDELCTHEQNLEVGKRAGLELVTSYKSSQPEWDHFEMAIWATVEQELLADPENKEKQIQAKHWRDWREAYLRWGRNTMGFACYLWEIKA